MIYFLSHKDIQNPELELKIADELKKYPQFIYLASRQSIKVVRQKTSCLSSLLVSYDENVDFSANLYHITEFIQSISGKVYKDGGYLSIADQKYILVKVINNYYNNGTRQRAMYQMRYELYELYQLLMFHNTKLSDEQLKNISLDFSDVEADIFAVYQLYRKVIDDLLIYASQGVFSKTLALVLGNEFLKSKARLSDTFINKRKQYIQERIDEVDAIFFDGVFYLDEMVKFIISAAILKGKAVYIISKRFESSTDDFIFDKGVKDFVDSFSAPVEKIHLHCEETAPKTALEHIKRLFPVSNKTKIVNAEKLIRDGSIVFVQPFINREEELRYVVKAISLQLKKAYKGNPNELIQMLNNDIAIVLPVKNTYEERISNIFREIGLFVFNQDRTRESSFAEVDTDTFAEVYFSRNDFLITDIKWKTGELFQYQEKYAFLEKCFDRICVNKFPRPIASYPIGQFVLEIYRIISEGITIEGFKRILYSNWRYNVDKIQFRWSDFISDFKYLEIYFESKKTLSQWCDTVDELIVLKSEMAENSLYVYHPLRQVKTISLNLFKSLLSELNEIANQIGKVSGSVNDHLSILKSVVMKADRILSIDDENLEFEQIVLKKLASAISDIGGSSVVNNLEAQYFAQNIRVMLTDWENQNQSEETGILNLNFIKLENMKNYKYTYFIMCEADKYPSKYSESFPFNEDILAILKNPKYGINITLQEYNGLDNHLNFERYLFKNVLDFTTEKLVITHCVKEGNSRKTLSVYAKDIATAFNCGVPYVEPKIESSCLSVQFREKSQKIHLEKKKAYTLTELAIFKLCPKLYYHQQTGGNRGAYLNRLQLKFYAEAVLYCDLFQRFMDYNLKNKKVYLKNSTEYLAIISELFKECCKDNVKFFSFFNKYEIEDTVRSVSNKLRGFIENSIQYLEGNTYTIISYQDKNYEGNGYVLTIEHDNRVVDYDRKTWRMSQNKSYLEFLVLKTSDSKTELKHYADMIDALDKNLPNLDRVNIISRIVAKINIQFDSKRFADDGIKRTDDLVSQICSYDFGEAEAMKSGHCAYCRFYNACMAN